MTRTPINSIPNILLLVIAISNLFYFTLCNAQRVNTGTYTYLKRKNNLHKSFIKGKLFDRENGQALKIAAIKINNNIIKADTNGFFSYEALPGRYKIIGLCYPYRIVTTKPLTVKAGETINIKFYLLIDKSPLND